jgi:hypothetical protein
MTGMKTRAEKRSCQMAVRQKRRKNPTCLLTGPQLCSSLTVYLLAGLDLCWVLNVYLMTGQSLCSGSNACQMAGLVFYGGWDTWRATAHSFFTPFWSYTMTGAGFRHARGASLRVNPGISRFHFLRETSGSTPQKASPEGDGCSLRSKVTDEERAVRTSALTTDYWLLTTAFKQTVRRVSNRRGSGRWFAALRGSAAAR